MLTRIIVFCTSLLLIIALLPGIKDILDSLRVSMADLTGFTAVESAYWGLFPLFLLVAFFAGGLYYLIKGGGDRENRGDRWR